MTDKELLELAAKAAGIKYDAEKSAIKETAKVWWGLWLSYDREPNEFDRRYWNPLTDDGDAFRLAVKLFVGINVSREESATIGEILRHMHFDRVVEYSTRRAIVRAAAEIGKGMK